MSMCRCAVEVHSYKCTYVHTCICTCHVHLINAFLLSRDKLQGTPEQQRDSAENSLSQLAAQKSLFKFAQAVLMI
jgi:hypothetical protein